MPLRLLLKFIFLIISALAVSFALSACSNNGYGYQAGESTQGTLLVSTTKKTDFTTSTQQNKSESDGVTYVILDDGNTIISGSGVTFENNVLTISKGGTYNLTGTLSDGKIYVNSADEDKKVKIILEDVSVFCSSDAPFYVENSPKETIIILADGSNNFLSDSAREVPQEENADYATAVIYSKDDLQIEGNGSLVVTGVFNKGIFSKNDIDIRGGNISVTSADDGIRGKDGVEISGGTVSIKAGGDGIRTSETQQQGKGNITVSGGKISVTSELDGLQAVADINISGGEITVVSGGGATGNTASDSQPMMPGAQEGKGPMGFFGPPSHGRPPADSSYLESTAEDTPSKKGIKADKNMYLQGGTANISSLDDSIHAENIFVDRGEFTFNTDDDGVHADEKISVGGGEIKIVNSYEGIEGKKIEIDGGRITLKASDDGFNAANGESHQGGRPDMAADESCEITVTGGYIHIDADGDGIDSNGNVKMSGGTLIIFGPENGANGALDYAGSFTITDGTLLALGCAGMAQSVSASDEAAVVAFKYNQGADTLVAITEDDGEMCVAFKNTKSYSTVVFAGDEVDSDETYNVYYGGSVAGEFINGVCFDGEYSVGSLVGTVSS